MVLKTERMPTHYIRGPQGDTICQVIFSLQQNIIVRREYKPLGVRQVIRCVELYSNDSCLSHRIIERMPTPSMRGPPGDMIDRNIFNLKKHNSYLSHSSG